MNIFKRLVLGGALAATFAVPLLTPTKADAYWGPRWGWGWHAGFVVGAPRIVVGAPVVAYPPYGYAPYRWIPAHYTPWGAFVPAHWGY
jgi:hypothetical protein